MILPPPGTPRLCPSGDYAFWLGADDVVDPPEREKLQALLDGLQVAEAEARNGPHSRPYDLTHPTCDACRGSLPVRLRGLDAPYSTTRLS